jgi:hypothetical protein
MGKKMKYSEYDSKGKLQVACCECKRGGNGDASCSSGWKSKKWDYKACFCGELLDALDDKLYAVESLNGETTITQDKTFCEEVKRYTKTVEKVVYCNMDGWQIAARDQDDE